MNENGTEKGSARALTTEKLAVTGMTCAACQANVTKRVARLAGVESVNVSLLANQMTVTYDPKIVTRPLIIDAVKEIGYGAALPDEQKSEGGGFKAEWQQRRDSAEEGRRSLGRRLTVSVILLIPLMYVAMGAMIGLPMPGFLSGMENAPINAFTQLLIAAPILIINGKFFTVGFRALAKRAPNMDSLVATGSAAAALYGILAMYMMMYAMGHGDMDTVHTYAHQLYFESSAMILTLVTVGKYLEARSKAKTSDALGKLVDLAPKTAVVLRDGVETVISAENVVAGDTVVIRPGERIPVDGIVLEGSGYVDQAAITGESIPVSKHKGDEVISATINKNGSFTMRATKVGDDTTLAQIIRLVDDAGNSKAPIARLADKVSGVFVPVVIGIALVTAIIWLVTGAAFEFALSCAISVLVISCPCALGLATPVAIMVGTGKAAENGILIKSAQSLEQLHSIDTIVLDKTGTITSGHPAVTDVVIIDENETNDGLLCIAAAVERGSEHPLAEAVAEKAHGLRVLPAADFEAHSGRGVSAKVEGDEVIGGNAAFMQERGVEEYGLDKARKISAELASQGKTPLLFAKNGKMCGVIGVADEIKESSREAVKRFVEMGLRVVMLTGDNGVTAEAIRRELGISEAVADVLPAGKEAHIRALRDQGHKVVMIGDGINDAPALMRADVGMAIGAGTDIAIDSAGVVLMKDSLEDAVTAIELSRSVMKNIKMNLFWAFFYNVLGIPIAAGVLYPATGLLLSPMLGAAAMSLSSVCVVGNALRLRFFKPKHKTVQNEEIIKLAEAEEKEKQMKDRTIVIEGMMCEHCSGRVQKALAGVAGVKRAEVDLAGGKASVAIEDDVADAALKGAVEDAGYTVKDIK